MLSADGDHVMLRLEAELEPRLADGAELGHVADWASKLNGAIARLAGLLHLAEHLRTGWDQPISAETVDDAARLGHYYLAHALAVFDLMDADPASREPGRSWIGSSAPAPCASPAASSSPASSAPASARPPTSISRYSCLSSIVISAAHQRPHQAGGAGRQLRSLT